MKFYAYHADFNVGQREKVMSKYSKDFYEQVAKIHRDVASDIEVVRAWVDVFTQDNPWKFHPRKFVEACGWNWDYYNAYFEPPDWDELDKYILGQPSIYDRGIVQIVSHRG